MNIISIVLAVLAVSSPIRAAELEDERVRSGADFDGVAVAAPAPGVGAADRLRTVRAGVAAFSARPRVSPRNGPVPPPRLGTSPCDAKTDIACPPDTPPNPSALGSIARRIGGFIGGAVGGALGLAAWAAATTYVLASFLTIIGFFMVLIHFSETLDTLNPVHWVQRGAAIGSLLGSSGKFDPTVGPTIYDNPAKYHSPYLSDDY